MQTQKPEIREKILNRSRSLFYKRGFEKTTMRQIASGVRMSVSNLYKYFRNKEELFDELVSGFHFRYLIGYKAFLSHSENHGFDRDAGAMLARGLFESIKGHTREFVLLMEKSRGTKYEPFASDLTALLVEHISHDVNIDPGKNFMVEVFVRNLFNGMTEIARNHKSDAQTLSHITLLAQYHIRGISILYR